MVVSCPPLSDHTFEPEGSISSWDMVDVKQRGGDLRMSHEGRDVGKRESLNCDCPETVAQVVKTQRGQSGRVYGGVKPAP